MKIKKIVIKDCGPFKGTFELSFEAPFVIVVDKNETGKSTIADAILVALYWEKDDLFFRLRGGERPEIELEFTKGNQEYKIKRLPEKPLVWVDGIIDRDILEKRGRRYVYVVGEKILGLTKDEFLKTTFLRQHELIKMDDMSSLTSHLQRIADSESGELSAKDVIKRLEEGKRRFPRITTELKREGSVTDEIRYLERKLDKKKKELIDLKKKAKTGEDIVREYDELLKENERLKREEESLRLTELKRLLDEDDDLRKSIEKLKAVLAELEVFKNCPVDKDEEITKMLTRIEDKRKEIENKTIELEKIEASLKNVETHLERYGHLSGATRQDLEDIEDIERDIKNLSIDKDRKEEKIREKEKDFKWDLNEFDRLYRVFSNLASVELRCLDEYEPEKIRCEKEKDAISYQQEEKRRIKKQLELKNRWVNASALLLFLIGIIGGFAITPATFLLSVIALLTYLLMIRDINNRLNGVNDELRGLYKSEEEVERKLFKIEDDYKRLVQIYNITIDDYKIYKLGIGEYREILGLKEALDEIREKINELTIKGHSFLNRFNLPISTSLGELINRLKEYLRLVEDHKDLLNQKGRLKNELDNLESTCKEIEGEIRTLAERAGIPFDQDTLISEIGERFKEASQKAREYYEKKGEIENKERKKLPDEIREAYELEFKSLRDKGIDIRVDVREISLELSKIRKKLDDNRNKIDRLKQNYRELMDDVRKIKDLEEEIEGLERHYKKATAYNDALERAISILSEISTQYHKVWADELNARANTIFKGITGIDRSISFNPDLTFSIKDGERILSQDEIRGSISGGTVEQLHLSIRIALSDYFSGNLKLPLILDEPFAHSDDSRFLSGIRYLVDVSNERQVIVFSCHELRHNALRDLPEIIIRKLNSYSSL
jgi:DNA repair exonuclease SbcCD ATPase subunit